MPDNKIDLALKEIGPAEKVLVDISPEGVIIKIHKGEYFTPSRYGVKKKVIIDEEITR